MPPVIAVTSTVSPVVKSKMREPGVSSTGSPSWLMVGGPSSRVQLVMKFRRSTRRPVRTGAENGQRAEIGKLVDLGIAR